MARPGAVMDMTITRFVRCDGEGDLKAFCDVLLGEEILIKGIRIVSGRKGPFISMPRQCSKAGKWYDSVVLLSREAKAALNQAVLEAFHTEELNA